MTSAQARRLRAPALALLVLALPSVAGASALDVFYERTVMTAADARCGLFAAPVSAALDAGRAQARNAALRSGEATSDLAAVERRARAKAAATPCASPDLGVAANRVRNAFDGFAKLTRMAYPGDVADWRADRGAGRAIRWRLAQDSTFAQGRMIFGLAGRDGEGALMAVADFTDPGAPYTARLLMRDTSRSSGPYLDARGRDPKGRAALASRMPTGFAVRVFPAAARSPAGADLAAKTMRAAWAFRFSPEAAAALADLDPRESVAVEFVMPDEKVRRAYVEVGDFAAGRAFLKLAQR